MKAGFILVLAIFTGIGASAPAASPEFAQLEDANPIVRMRAYSSILQEARTRTGEVSLAGALPAAMRVLARVPAEVGLYNRPQSVDNYDSTDLRSALDLIRAIGPEAVPALALVLDRAKPGCWTTDFALRAIQAMGPPAKSAIPALVELMNDPAIDLPARDSIAYSNRDQAVAALAAIDMSDARFRSALARAVVEGRGERSEVNRALIRLGSVDAEIARAVINVVPLAPPRDIPSSGWAGSSAVTAPELYRGFFEKFGSARRDVLPDLIQLARDNPNRPGILNLAFKTIQRIEPLPQEFDAALLAKVGTDFPANKWVYPILERIGPRARDATPALLAQLRGGPAEEKLAAVRLLSRIGLPYAGPAIPEIEALVAPESAAFDQRTGYALEYCESLLRVAPRSEPGLRGLELVCDRNWRADKVVEAHALLVKYGRNPEVHYAALEALMNRSDYDTQLLAAVRIVENPGGEARRRTAIEGLIAMQEKPTDRGLTFKERAAAALLDLAPTGQVDGARILNLVKVLFAEEQSEVMTRVRAPSMEPNSSHLIVLTQVLSRLEPRPAGARQLLEEMQRSYSPPLREAAAGRYSVPASVQWPMGSELGEDPVEF